MRYVLFLLFLIMIAASGCVSGGDYMVPGDQGQEIKLPEPSKSGGIPVEEAIAGRRSVRDYGSEPLKLSEVSQLLWSAQGMTSPGKRSAPSAGATYPLELYVVAGNVGGLDEGVYRYVPERNSLVKVLDGDKRRELSEAALSQQWVEKAPADLVFSAVFGRTTGSYGERGRQYVYQESGHAAQNAYLQSESLGLGTVVVGAFSEEMVSQVLSLPQGEVPLYIMPVGHE